MCNQWSARTMSWCKARRLINCQICGWKTLGARLASDCEKINVGLLWLVVAGLFSQTCFCFFVVVELVVCSCRVVPCRVCLHMFLLPFCRAFIPKRHQNPIFPKF